MEKSVSSLLKETLQIHFICLNLCLKSLPFDTFNMQSCLLSFQSRNRANKLLLRVQGCRVKDVTWKKSEFSLFHMLLAQLHAISRPYNRSTDTTSLHQLHRSGFPPLPVEVYPAIVSFHKQLLQRLTESLQAQRSGANVLMDYGVSLCLVLLTGFIGWEDELVTLYIIIVLRPVCPCLAGTCPRINVEIISEMNSQYRSAPLVMAYQPLGQVVVDYCAIVIYGLCHRICIFFFLFFFEVGSNKVNSICNGFFFILFFLHPFFTLWYTISNKSQSFVFLSPSFLCSSADTPALGWSQRTGGGRKKRRAMASIST